MEEETSNELGRPAVLASILMLHKRPITARPEKLGSFAAAEFIPLRVFTVFWV